MSFPVLARRGAFASLTSKLFRYSIRFLQLRQLASRKHTINEESDDFMNFQNFDPIFFSGQEETKNLPDCICPEGLSFCIICRYFVNS
jgi:hypothetical protein